MPRDDKIGGQHSILSSILHSLIPTHEDALQMKQNDIISNIQQLNIKIQKYDTMYDKLTLQLNIAKKRKFLRMY